MEQVALEKFVRNVRNLWGPPTDETVAAIQKQVDEFARAPFSPEWLNDLRESPEPRELYRDPDHGFVLVAYSEKRGLYRQPHDHGDGWVVYAVQSGETEMGSYGKIMTPEGELGVLRRDLSRLRTGESRVYLPGDIHDTKCVSESVLIFRLTSVDLKKEAREGRMSRYEV